MKRMATLILAAVLCGCATLQSPRVSLVDLRIVSLTLFEQSYALQIRIQNPNPVDLPITGMNFRLDVNDTELGNGVSNQAVTVPAYGDAVMQIKLVSNLARILDQMRGLEGGSAQNLRYRLVGDVHIANRLGTLPFDYQGQIGLQQ
jgi:LEA14-like dessication related protein